MIFYVLTENEAHEGGSVMGVYSTMQKARDEAPPPSSDIEFWAIVPVEVDTPPANRDSIRAPGSELHDAT